MDLSNVVASWGIKERKTHVKIQSQILFVDNAWMKARSFSPDSKAAHRSVRAAVSWFKTCPMSFSTAFLILVDLGSEIDGLTSNGIMIMGIEG